VPRGEIHALRFIGQEWPDFFGRLPLSLLPIYLERIPDKGLRKWKEFQTRAKARY
jgi:hypothetical protein